MLLTLFFTMYFSLRDASPRLAELEILGFSKQYPKSRFSQAVQYLRNKIFTRVFYSLAESETFLFQNFSIASRCSTVYFWKTLAGFFFLFFFFHALTFPRFYMQYYQSLVFIFHSKVYLARLRFRNLSLKFLSFGLVSFSKLHTFFRLIFINNGNISFSC